MYGNTLVFYKEKKTKSNECVVVRFSGTSDPIKWGCSSAGRAPALQAGGQGFDSLHLHQSRRRQKVRNKGNGSRKVPVE